MGLVQDQQGAVATGEGAERIVVVGLRRNDSDVGHRRFGQYGCHLPVRKSGLEPGDVVPLDDAGGRRQIDRWTDVSAARLYRTVRTQGGEGLIHGAVVAVVVDEHDAAAGDLA